MRKTIKTFEDGVLVDEYQKDVPDYEPSELEIILEAVNSKLTDQERQAAKTRILQRK